MAKKRTFDVLRKRILKTMGNSQKTVNQISTESSINWKTVDNHIIHLIGKGYVKVVFESKYVKIYEISDKGKEVLKRKS